MDIYLENHSCYEYEAFLENLAPLLKLLCIMQPFIKPGAFPINVATSRNSSL